MAVAKKRLFVIFSVLTCVLLISLSVTAIFAWRKADFATTINFEYSYGEQEYIFEETASGALVLTGLGPAYQGDELEVPSQNSQKAVVGISDNAFLNNQTITTVIIPKSVTSIGEYAFAGCENLTSVTVEDNSELTEIGYAAFQSCSNLQTVDFGANSKLETIGAHAFCENSSLTEIIIPESVKHIEELAFNGCDNLTSVYISTEDSSSTIEANAFANFTSSATIYCSIEEKPAGWATGWSGNSNVVLGHIEGLTFTLSADGQSYAISSCDTSISGELVLKETYKGLPVTTINNAAIRDCNNLKEVFISKNIINIGESIFQGCTNLTDIVVDGGNIKYHSVGNCLIDKDSKTLITGTNASIIPTNGEVTSIANKAFYYMVKLTTITIPSSVVSVGSRIFVGCYGLQELKVDENNPNYYSSGNCLIEKSTKTIISGCNNSVIPTEGVEKIGMYAFSDYNGLTTITIPNNVLVIDDCAFYYCQKLTTVVIGNKCNKIGYYAFGYCSKLTSVTFVDPNNWFVASSPTATNGTDLSSTDLSNTLTAATYLKDTYKTNYWFKDSN